MFKKSILIIMFILLAFSVYGRYNYTEIGNPDGYYQNDYTLFNDALDFDFNNDRVVRGLGQGRLYPIVSDLDSDGVMDVVIIDDTTLKVYRGSSLTPNTSLEIPNSTGTYSHWISYDIDADGYQEIILADNQANEDIFIFNYTPNVLALEVHHAVDSATHTTGEFMLKCGDTQECLVIYPHVSSSVAGATLTYARFFNTTTLSGENLVYSSINAHAVCIPKIPNVAYSDVDGDGEEEYIYTLMSGGGGVNDERVVLQSLWFNKTNFTDYTLELNKWITVSDYITSGIGTNCVDVADYVSSPIVFDFEIGGNPEIVIAYNEDADEFIMDAYKSTGSQVSSAPYPEILQADGMIISNPARMDAFGDGSAESVCVMGFDDTSDRLDVLCAKDGGFPTDAREHIIYNFTTDLGSSYLSYVPLIHSVQATGGGNDEILSTLGVYEITWDTTCPAQQLLNNDCGLDLLFPMPVENGTVISVDADKYGWEDLIVMTVANLYYLEDSYTFSGAEITDYTIDPCTSGVWEVDVNNSNIVQIQYQITDPDGDDINGRSCIYYGDSYEQCSNYSVTPLSSGAYITDVHYVNVTDSSMVVRIEGNDTSNPSEVDYREWRVSVAGVGYKYGDGCITTFELEEDEDELTAEEIALQTNNSITNAIEDVKEVVNLNLPNTIIWLIIMLVVGIIIAYNGLASDKSVSSTLAVISIVETILFLIGVQLGFVNIIYLWIMVILALGLIAFKIRSSAVGG